MTQPDQENAPARHPQYWRIKAAVLEQRMAIADAQAAATAANAKFEQVMAQTGLDPALRYKLDDASETITEQPQG
jgi:hypothetical protein